MISVFKTGIVSKITGSSFNTLISSRVYADEYPQATKDDKVSYPNMVFHLTSNTPTRDSHGYFEPIQVQFNVYTDEDTTVSSKKGNALMDYLVDQFMSLMDDASLSVTGYDQLICHRVLAHPLAKADDSTIWGWAIIYLIELEKQ